VPDVVLNVERALGRVGEQEASGECVASVTKRDDSGSPWVLLG